MEEVRIPGIDAAYRKQGADFSRYAKVLIVEPSVAFREGSRPQDDATLSNIELPDLVAIRQRVSSQFQQILAARLQENGGYAVVTAPAPDVLQVKAAITDLYFSPAAIRAAATGKEPYYVDLSEVTLVMELHDSATGSMLSRAYDHRASGDSGAVELEKGVWSSPALQEAMNYWASLLRRLMDDVKAKK